MLPMYEHCLQTMFSKTQTLTLYAQYSIILPNIDLRQSRVLNISQANIGRAWSAFNLLIVFKSELEGIVLYFSGKI